MGEIDLLVSFGHSHHYSVSIPGLLTGLRPRLSSLGESLGEGAGEDLFEAGFSMALWFSI